MGNKGCYVLNIFPILQPCLSLHLRPGGGRHLKPFSALLFMSLFYHSDNKLINRAIINQSAANQFRCRRGLKRFTTQSRLLTTLSKKSFKNIVGKGENAGNQHFLLFPQCYHPYQRQK